MKWVFAFGLILAPACWGAFGTPAAGDRCYANVTSGTTASCTITNQPAAGDVIIYSGDLFSTLTISSVKDNAGSPNTFAIPTGTNLTSGCDTTHGGTAGSDCVAYLIEPNGSGGTTFTVTASGACGACSIIIDRFPVTSGTAAFDSAAGGHGTSFAITAPTITVSGSNELIWGGCTNNNTCTGVTGSWTLESGGLHTFAEGAEFQLSVSANTAVGFSGSGNADDWDATGISFSFTPSGAAGPVGQLYFKKQAVNRAATYFIDTFLRPLWLPQPEIAFMTFKSRAEYIKQLLGFRKKWTLMDWKTSEGDAVFEPPVTDQQIHEYCELNR